MNEYEIIESKSDDVQNTLYSHYEWQSAPRKSTKTLNKKFKEPETLIFCGAICECTFNVEKIQYLSYMYGIMKIFRENT